MMKDYKKHYSEKEKSVKSPPSVDDSHGDSLENIIHQQSADGSFKFGQVFEDLIGLDFEEIQAKCPQNIEMKIWITAISVTLLEKKFAADKNLWELIVNKAKKYLKKHTKNTEEILEVASKLF